MSKQIKATLEKKKKSELRPLSLSLSLCGIVLKARAMERKHNFLHGTLEATIFYATPYTPLSPFNVCTRS